jgi:4-hydroxybenzoyl-CoA reductase subunit beta
MMRLPPFAYRAPETVKEAVSILAAEGPQAMVIAGGTDLLPNMKRRQQEPKTLVSLRRIEPLKRIANGAGLRLGPALTLARVIEAPGVRERYRALWQAAAQVATPQIRNSATLGGNLCVDTRCGYYNQNHDWRQAIGFCVKTGGEVCWMATNGRRCFALSASDCAPALIALGATVQLASASGEREVALSDFYRNDGKQPLNCAPGEVLTEVKLPAAGWKSCYWKLRARGAFDFALLGVAAAVRAAPDGTVEDVRVVLGGIASRPMVIDAGGALGTKLADEAIARVAARAVSAVTPQKTDLDLDWRKKIVTACVGYALRELRGEDMSATRMKTARQPL